MESVVETMSRCIVESGKKWLRLGVDKVFDPTVHDLLQTPSLESVALTDNPDPHSILHFLHKFSSESGLRSHEAKKITVEQ
jgi:hypothetical protein